MKPPLNNDRLKRRIMSATDSPQLRVVVVTAMPQSCASLASAETPWTVPSRLTDMADVISLTPIVERISKRVCWREQSLR